MRIKIERTDRIFIVGRSGSGKTTLAREIIKRNKAYNFFRFRRFRYLLRFKQYG